MVRDILPVDENDLLVVQREEKEVLIPFSQSICVEVNIEKKIIVCDPPEGLLD
jgi:ribosomal 30S subunit maturation factor RimM